MVDANIPANEEKGKYRESKILTKPLPEILDEMESNISTAIEAARQAETAAREAKDAEESAMSSARQATQRADEASIASREAAELRGLRSML